MRAPPRERLRRNLTWVRTAVVPFLMMAASPAGAQALGLEPEVEAARREAGLPVRPGLWRLYGEDPTLSSTEDLAQLRRMIGKATVVGLGESWHTSGGLYKMKHRIFRNLVQNMGFRVFAIESHWVSGEKANGILFLETSERMQPTASAPCRRRARVSLFSLDGCRRGCRQSRDENRVGPPCRFRHASFDE